MWPRSVDFSTFLFGAAVVWFCTAALFVRAIRRSPVEEAQSRWYEPQSQILGLALLVVPIAFTISWYIRR